jgi:hypothetical protein
MSGLLMMLLALLAFQLVSGLIVFSLSHVGLGIVLCLGAILMINWTFYRFLLSRKGWRFSCSALPMHVFYYLYSAVSFIIGTGVYLLRFVQGQSAAHGLLIR